MKRLIIQVAWLLAALALPLSAAAAELPHPEIAQPKLTDFWGKRRRLTDFMLPETKALVVYVMNTQCTLTSLYLPTVKELAKAYAKEGVQVIGIYPNWSENLDLVSRQSFEADIPFPLMLDREGLLAQKIGVDRTPEVVLLDKDLNVRYRGAIDDQYHQGAAAVAAPQHTYLKDAIDAVLADKPVATADTESEGCLIDAKAPPSSGGEVTYAKNVAPIIQDHCQVCHRPGQVAPFSLTSYDQVKSHAKVIKEVVEERRMPPWSAVTDEHIVGGKLENDLSLSQQEIDTLGAWVEAGMPEGDIHELAPPRDFGDATGWTIGKPDAIYSMDEDFPVPATGVLDYQFFRVKIRFPTDRWVRAVEVKPGAPRVVHHIELHVVPASDTVRYVGRLAILQLYTASDEDAVRLLGSYVPGDTEGSKPLPADQAMLIPANTDIVMEVHYTPNGVATTDRSQIGFIFADPPKVEVKTRVFRKRPGLMTIPANNPDYPIEDEYWFKSNVELYTLRAHMHSRAKNYKLELVHLDGKRETLLSIPRWDFNWQRTYALPKPLSIKAGETLHASAHWDNSSFNPNNPDPKRNVPWGIQTFDEMFNTRVTYREVSP